MFRDCGGADCEGFGEFFDRRFAERQTGENGAARGIGQSRKGGAELVGLCLHNTYQLINLLVYYNRVRVLSSGKLCLGALFLNGASRKISQIIHR